METEQAEVLVLGGGITGISLASMLARNGVATILLEKHDFTSGTSQASGMMIWGGLLYLRNFEFLTVGKFCRSRDRLLLRRPDEVIPRGFTYLVARRGGRSAWLMWSALQLYRALSCWKRSAVRKFPLEHLPEAFDGNLYATGLTYEEGFLVGSDTRFGVRNLARDPCLLTALNHHEIESLERRGDGRYEVVVRSSLNEVESRFECDKVVNCCGVWADGVNARFGMRTRHRHHFSKGVYLLLDHRDEGAFVMDSGDDGDVLCWVPWGEVTMWGPTETTITGLDEAHATAEDVDWLLAQLNCRSPRRWTRADIANVRCGVRPLAVLPEIVVRNPLDLSRKVVVEKDPQHAWWTVFGGKLSGAEDAAAFIYQEVVGAEARCRDAKASNDGPPLTREFFLGREIPDPVHCRNHEGCGTLEDYLRRRSNLAQWIPRGGFGRDDEFADDLLEIATRLLGEPAVAERALQDYRAKVTLERSRWYPHE